MSAFKFNFGGGEDAAAEAAPAPAPAPAPTRAVERVDAVEAGDDDAGEEETFAARVGDETFALAKKRTDDLVEAGVYEGGAELWECALDLAAFLDERDAADEGGPKTKKARTEAAEAGAGDARYACRGKRVLELGCGRGLPGLWALRRGAARVVFADYDASVLRDLTRRDAARERRGDADVRFYAGDWRALPEALAADGVGRFDVVLSAETAYREDTAAGVVAAAAACLAPGGVALMATKRYYFGCGGGTLALEDAAARVPGLACAVVASVEDGRSNIRDLLELRWEDDAGGVSEA